MASTTEIVFGALPLLSPMAGLSDYDIEICADGTDYGNPEEVVSEVTSMLMDGNKAEVIRFGNHVVTLKVRVRGGTLDAVADGQAALQAEVNKGRNTLSWLPPGWSTVSVFDVVYSVLKFEFDDLAETRIERYLTLTLTCLPGARRDTLTTVVADPVPTGSPTVTSIDACTSTTGWAVTDATLSTSGGAIVVDDVIASPGVSTVTRAGLAVTVAAGEYVRLDIESTLGTVFAVGFDGDAPMSVAAIELTGPARRYFYLQVTSPFSGVTVQLQLVGSGPGQAKIHDVSKVDRLPSAGPYQRSFTADVGGTARTAADLVIESDDGLGDEVMIYTAPTTAAIDPPLRRWFFAAGSADADAVSGEKSSAPVIATIPVTAIPAGPHLIVARLKLASGGPSDVDVTWSSTLELSPWVDPATNVTETVTVPLTTDYSFHALGVVELPTAAVDPTSGAYVTVNVTDPDTAGFKTDDVWLYNLEAGVLTWLTGLTADSDTPSKVEIRSATIDRDNPGWLVGTAETDADNVDASARAASPGVHEFAPGLMSIFVMTPGATEQTVSLELYERFQHHVTGSD